ncbi:MAG TPA: zf-HC2 domain-containing protein [Actinomycetota bacterium]|nr:zf-HC2 domain-containing protein [Actinomycetota bacterium]
MNPLSCPDVEELAPELALGTLPGDQRSAVLAHLDRCPDCRRYLNKLSDTADSLLLLAPEVDPPAGFTRRVVAGLTPGRRRWRPMALAAVAALVIGLAVGYVPGHVGSGSANVAVASFVDTGAEPGETVGGRVYARADNPSWVFMTVHGSGSDESYACDLVLKDGRTVTIGSFTMHAGTGSWGRAVNVTLSQVRQVQLRDARGTLVAKAPLGAS